MSNGKLAMTVLCKLIKLLDFSFTVIYWIRIKFAYADYSFQLTKFNSKSILILSFLLNWILFSLVFIPIRVLVNFINDLFGIQRCHKKDFPLRFHLLVFPCAWCAWKKLICQCQFLTSSNDKLITISHAMQPTERYFNSRLAPNCLQHVTYTYMPLRIPESGWRDLSWSDSSCFVLGSTSWITRW